MLIRAAVDRGVEKLVGEALRPVRDDRFSSADSATRPTAEVQP